MRAARLYDGTIGTRLGDLLRVRHLLPGVKCLGTDSAIAGDAQPMAAGTKQVTDSGMDSQKPLSLAGGLKPVHLSLLLPRGLMRYFRLVVQAARQAVLNAGKDLSVSGAVAAQLIGDEPPGHVAPALEQLLEKALSHALVAPFLHEDIQRLVVLLPSSPEIMDCTVDLDLHLIQVPFVPGTRLTAAQLRGIAWAELTAPLTNGFIDHEDPTLGEDIFDLSQAQREAVVEPDGVADDRGWIAITGVKIRGWLHRPIMPGRTAPWPS
jgi:hypothetical protein